MRVVRIHRFGGPEVLSLDEVDPPQPGAGEAVVRVRGASVNPVDYKMREGEFPPLKADALPVVLGRDLAGVVARVGEGCELKEGDEVLAHLGWGRGGYADEVVVRPGEWARKPAEVDWMEAAGLPLAADTAWQGLFDHGRLRSGERVLVHGASGGVGHLAVQFARVTGAEVWATAGAEHLDLVRELGADHAIDYKAQRFEDVAHDLDLVFDTQGGETRARSWATLKPGGRLVTTVGTGDVEAEAREHGCEGAAFMAEPRGSDLRRVAAMLADGRVRVRVERTFPLAQAADAHRAAEHDHPAGKLVLQA